MSYVTVRVWVSRLRLMTSRPRITSPGHASLAIRPDSTTASDGYVSFAPEQSGSIHGPGKFYPLDYDLAEYDNSDHDSPRGHWVGKIYGLDVDKMYDQFLEDSKYPQTYSPANQCAIQVHKYLQIGGGDQFSGRWARTALFCWSPDDVEDYARSIVNQTRHLGSTGTKVVGAGTMWPW